MSEQNSINTVNTAPTPAPEQNAVVTDLNNLHYTVNALLRKLQRLAEERIAAQKKIVAAQQKMLANPGWRRSVAVQEAEDRHEGAVAAFRKGVTEIREKMGEMEGLVEEVYEYFCINKPRKAQAFRKQEQRFADSVTEKIFIICSQFDDESVDEIPVEQDTAPAAQPEEVPAEEPKPSYGEYVPNYAPAPAPAPAPMYYTDMRPNLNLAPITIDISAYVEHAVAAAMERFSVAFGKKADEIADAVALPAAPAAGVAVASISGASVAAASQVAAEEGEIAARLADLMNQVAAMSAEIDDLANKMQEVNAAQQQTNDLQRHTAREQQGIAVNQRVIAGEQIAVAEQQALLGEQQKVAQEQAQAITEQQQAMMDAQNEVGETMKSVLQSQKDLISGQQSIMQGTAKCVEAQGELAARHADVTKLQKENAQVLKQLMREQKTLNEKTAAKPQKPEKADKAEKAE